MASPRTWLFDGFFSLEGGMDGGRPPSTLTPIQVARAVNATFRGGYSKPRIATKRIPITFAANDEGTWDQGTFSTGRFQGAGSYISPDGTAFIFLSIGGQIYGVPLDGSTHMAVNQTANQAGRPAPPAWSPPKVPGQPNSPTLSKAWFCQAEEFLIVQDNQSRPLIWNGATFRRATDDEVPTGGPMAYGIGRLWVARGREYFGGDLVWSDPSLGTASLLKFTENDFLNEGGAFMVPWQTGNITALSFTAQPDTVTGEGSLMVFTRSGIFEFAAPVDRTVWKDMEQPLQRFSLLNFGATSQESVTQVNGDLFFRAEDGIRSFFFARRDFNTWGNTPQSREVEPVMARDDQALLAWASAITFDNRFMSTAEPVWTDTGVEHRRLVALDFDLISGIRSKVPPAWDGEWVPSPRILQLVTTQQDTGRRAFMIARDENGMLGIWEFLPKQTGDDSQPPEWSIESKSFQFTAPLDRKRLTTVELWIDDVEGVYNIDTFWRSDNKGCWVPWARFTGFGSGCLTTPATGGNGDCSPPRMPVAQSRNRIGLPIAPDRMDQLNCEPFRDGYEFQLRLECTGHFVIKKARLVAELLSQEVYGRISDDCQALPADCQTCE